MRLLVECEVDRAIRVPLNHLHHLTAVAYRYLKRGDADYAAFLHDDGYGAEEGHMRFKLFCFSGLQSRQRSLDRDSLWLGPGPICWYIGSPLEPFLRNFATGLLSEGVIEVAGARLPVRQATAIPTPDFASGAALFSCLTPLVSRVAMPDGRDYFLRPSDANAFQTAIRTNLLRKHRALTGNSFHSLEGADADFSLTFDQTYLSDPRHRGGTKLIHYKDIDIVGALCPFKATGSPTLLRLLYDCGGGEKNASGFGMVEVRKHLAERGGEGQD